MPEKFIYKDISVSDINIIRPLWEKLNLLHFEDSKYFKDFYKSFKFEKRTEAFIKIPFENIRIETVSDDSRVIGYCISTVKDGGTGEIESLFIKDSYRKKGIGEALVKSALDWFKKKSCTDIQVCVAYGHESVFEFYEKFGFYPRLTTLKKQ